MREIAKIALTLLVLTGGAKHASADCVYKKTYSVGAVVKQDDRTLIACKEDSHWHPLSPANINILAATWGSDINSCDVMNAVVGHCRGSVCAVAATDDFVGTACNVPNKRLMVSYTCQIENFDIPGSADTKSLNQGGQLLISCGSP